MSGRGLRRVAGAQGEARLHAGLAGRVELLGDVGDEQHCVRRGIAIAAAMRR